MTRYAEGTEVSSNRSRMAGLPDVVTAVTQSQGILHAIVDKGDRFDLDEVIPKIEALSLEELQAVVLMLAVTVKTLKPQKGSKE